MHVSPREVGDLKADETEAKTEGLVVEFVGGVGRRRGGGVIGVAVGEAEVGGFGHEGLHFLLVCFGFAVVGGSAASDVVCLGFGGHACGAVVG